MGIIPELATAEVGYTGMRLDDTATIARTLAHNGYSTGAFGKMHQTPPWETTPAGPFVRWPIGEGFEKFYGFIGAETNQFAPSLIDGTSPIPPPESPDRGYHLSEDLVEQAISWIRSVHATDPVKPWMCYVSFGATHGPLHIPESWQEKYRGEFDAGWTAVRAQTLERQIEMGLVPAQSRLPDWPSDVPQWSELTGTQRTVFARLMEIYAAFAEHTDRQTGKIIKYLEGSEQLENTLIIYILGDNGAAAEVGMEGTSNEYAPINGHQDSADRMIDQLDLLGGPHSYPAYPVGWALAMDTPYKWVKAVASHYGGTRNGLIVRWGRQVRDPGQIRHQWHHCIDVAPTILEAARLPEPRIVDGVEQRPMDGVSFLYVLDEPEAGERHTRQYFEILGNRGIYLDGWTAVAKHRAPWEKAEDIPPFEEDRWELYDTNSDWTQATDLADVFPEKLAELKEEFTAEALRYDVLPLDDRLAERLDPRVTGRPDLMANRKSLTLTPDMPGLPELAALNLKNRSFSILASVVTGRGAGGVIVCQGGRFGGWSLYLRDGELVYCYNLVGRYYSYVRSRKRVSPAGHLLECRFAYDGGAPGRGGVITLFADGTRLGSGRIDQTTRHFFSHSETLDVGIDRHTPVTDEYGWHRENEFSGDIDWVRLEIGEDPQEPDGPDRLRAILGIH